MKCQHCEHTKHIVKNGKPRGVQRYKCTYCNHCFTIHEPRKQITSRDKHLLLEDYKRFLELGWAATSRKLAEYHDLSHTTIAKIIKQYKAEEAARALRAKNARPNRLY